MRCAVLQADSALRKRLIAGAPSMDSCAAIKSGALPGLRAGSACKTDAPAKMGFSKTLLL